MIRINIPWVIQVSESIDKIREISPGAKYVDYIYLIFSAKQNIENIYNSIYNQHIRVSRSKANQLLDIINNLLNNDEDYIITDVQAWGIVNVASEFKQLFHAEIGSMPAYLVARKEGYDVDLLADLGTALFPSSLLEKAPETERDALQAGKALVFEVATGCGFHVFRVMEAVVRRYWDEVSGGAKRPKLQTLGNFAAEMEKRGIGDVKIIESIKQMTRHHRNPIIHPDVILTVDEAIGIVCMARSAIGIMLSALPEVPPTANP